MQCRYRHPRRAVTDQAALQTPLPLHLRTFSQQPARLYVLVLPPFVAWLASLLFQTPALTLAFPDPPGNAPTRLCPHHSPIPSVSPNPTLHIIDKKTDLEWVPQPAGAEPTDPRLQAPPLPDLPWDPPVPRSRMPPCRASLHECCISPVAAEKQRCLRKGCCRNRGKFTGISSRGSGSSCVWSPESRQEVTSSFIHLLYNHSFTRRK